MTPTLSHSAYPFHRGEGGVYGLDHDHAGGVGVFFFCRDQMAHTTSTMLRVSRLKKILVI